MNKKFFAALASATMAFTASGSIAVFADDFVEESKVVDPGELLPVEKEVLWNEDNFGALVNGKVTFTGAEFNADVLKKGKTVKTADLAKVTHIKLENGFKGEIKGLKYFSGLTYFGAYEENGEKIEITNETLDFSANKKLDDLNLQEARILTGLTLPEADKNEDDEDVYHLVSVCVKNSKLTSLDLSNYGALNYVDVTFNTNLKEVKLPAGKKSDPKDIEKLGLNDNALETVNLDHYNVTDVFNLDGNHIGALDLSKTNLPANADFGTQTLYISEKAANVNLKEEVEGLNLFKVDGTVSKEYDQETGKFVLNTGTNATNSYEYNTEANGANDKTLHVVLTPANPMNRLYNPNSGEHFYTADLEEKAALVALGWNDEGYGWVAPVEGTGAKVYRLYNPNAGDHHYTKDAREARTLVSYGWKDEGIGWYSKGDVTVWRQYNPFANGAGSHNYTVDRAENDHLVSLGWIGEGKAWEALQ